MPRFSPKKKKKTKPLTCGLVQIKSRGRVSHHRPAVPPGSSTLRSSAHSTCAHSGPGHSTGPGVPRVAHVTPPPAIGQEGEGRGRLGASLPELPLQQPAEHHWATGQRRAARERSLGTAHAPEGARSLRGCGRCAGASSCDLGGWGGALEATPPSGCPPPEGVGW